MIFARAGKPYISVHEKFSKEMKNFSVRGRTAAARCPETPFIDRFAPVFGRAKKYAPTVAKIILPCRRKFVKHLHRFFRPGAGFSAEKAFFRRRLRKTDKPCADERPCPSAGGRKRPAEKRGALLCFSSFSAFRQGAPARYACAERVTGTSM